MTVIQQDVLEVVTRTSSPPPVADVSSSTTKSTLPWTSSSTTVMIPPQVIFLDVDGVIRPVDASKTYAVATIRFEGVEIPIVGNGSDFENTAMSALRAIVVETGAVLVLSSEW